MLKFILRSISTALSFSRTETRGTLILLIFVIFSFIVPIIVINQSKDNEPRIVENPEELEKWVAEVQASYTREVKSVKVRNHFNKTSYLATESVFSRQKEKKVKSVKKDEIRILDINKATVSELDMVRGIGSTYAKRIIKYRNLLGGYVHIEQLSEVYGLTAGHVQELGKHFNIQSGVIRIPLNSDSAKVLAKHPYISYDLAWIIINYRKANGNIKDAEELKKIKAIDEKLFDRLSPYLN